MAVWRIGHLCLLSIILGHTIIYGQKEVQLSVEFANGTSLETATFQEGSSAEISCPIGSGILVDSATYWVPGGRSSHSVTPFIKKPCHGNPDCSFNVTSKNLELSWFMQNQTKMLSIRYSCETVYQLCNPVKQHVSSQRGFVTLTETNKRYCSISIETRNSVALFLEKLSEAPQFYEFVLCNKNTVIIGVRDDIKCPFIMNPSQMLPSVKLPPNITIEVNTGFLQDKGFSLAFKGVEPRMQRYLHIPDFEGEQTTDSSISSAPSRQGTASVPDWLPIALGAGASTLLLLVILAAAVFFIRPRCRQNGQRIWCCKSKEMEYMEVASSKQAPSVRGRHNGHFMNVFSDSIYQDDIYERIDLTLRRSQANDDNSETLRSLTSDEGIGSTMSSASGPTLATHHLKTCREPRSSLPPVPSGGSPRIANGSLNMAELPVSPQVAQNDLYNHKYDNAEALLKQDDLDNETESDLESISSDLEIVDNELYSHCQPLKRSPPEET